MNFSVWTSFLDGAFQTASKLNGQQPNRFRDGELPSFGVLPTARESEGFWWETGGLWIGWPLERVWLNRVDHDW